MNRAQRLTIGVGITTALLLAAGCSSSSTPSTFGSGSGSGSSGSGSGGGPTDGASSETGSFGGSSGGDTFSCAGQMCNRSQWCLEINQANGNGPLEYCMDYGNCGDCTCIEGLAAAGKCAGYALTCTSMPPLIVTCEPSMDSGGPPPGDSGAGG